MVKNLCTLILGIFFCTAGWAQYTSFGTGALKISGKVVDASSSPIIGATVRVEGSNNGAATDVDGNYSFEMTRTGKMVIIASFIGYQDSKQEVDVKGNTTVDFTLQEDAVGLTETVVTGVVNAKSKLESSVSISTLNSRQVELSGARTTAEIFRSIPGIRSEASGGDGNTNITVRGVPISAGGAKYLSLQEDGLPVLLFGDIAFATPDIFLRADNTISRIEAIRGGSASTLGSNTPAGIINFISNTGSVQGGSVATSFGLDHNAIRTDFNFGSPIREDLSFNIGGFFRQGEGVRTAGYNANNGGQIKANITKRFSNGYARVYYKFLDDRTPAYMPMPVQVSGTNSNPVWGAAPGYDPMYGAMQTPNLLQNFGMGPDGQLRRSDVADGMHPITHSIGTEFSFDLGNDWKVEDRARMSINSGRFVAPFPAEVNTGTNLAASVAGAGAHLEYADKKDATDVFNNADQVMRIHMFDTELNNFNNYMNDFKVTKKINNINLSAGVFNAQQRINMSWLWNSYLMEMKGSNARLLNAIAANGDNYSANGLYAYGVPNWGNCCTRNYNTQYSVTAPYASASVELKNGLSVDASLRWDMGNVSGNYAGSSQVAYDVNQDGHISIPEQSVSTINNAAASAVHYKYNYLSYSIGANYKLNERSAIFARYSKGASAKADRILFPPTGVDLTVDKTVPAFDEVAQGELGYKLNMHNYGIFATLFYAKTDEQGGFEATTQKLIENNYMAYGLELESAAHFGDFEARFGLTYTNAKITNGANKDNTPRRQSPIIFNFSPSYTWKMLNVGINMYGTGKAYTQDDNKLVMPAYVVVNPYIMVKITKGLSAMINVNNVFNSLGITESENNAITENQVNIVRARPILGRSIMASVRYNF